MENNTNQKAKKRDVNIELLRIVAMLMVITIHCLRNGQLIGNSQISPSNLIIIQIMDSLSLVAVSTFFIISGYYMIEQKINLKKIFCLWGKVLFYSFLIYTVCTLMNRETNFYTSFFPVLSGQYWFVDAYIILYLFSPILNIILNKLTKNQFKYLIIFWIIMLGIIGLVFAPDGLIPSKIIAVFLIYAIGAYIRRFVELKSKQCYSAKYIALALVFTWLYFVLAGILGVVKDDIFYYLLYRLVTNFNEFYNIIVIVMTVIIFMKFKTMEIKSKTLSKIILFISPSIFSIYIIHHNDNIRNAIWLESGVMDYANSWIMIPYIILSIISVFIICLFIDLIRRGGYYIIKKISFFDYIINRINTSIAKLNSKINNSIGE